MFDFLLGTHEFLGNHSFPEFIVGYLFGAALIIAGIIAKGSSKIYGLEHLDRGYENFELKLKNLGIKITREVSKSTFEKNEYKIKTKSEKLSKLKAA